MRRLGLAVTALGIVGMLAGIGLSLWPMHANGVHGSAFRPKYVEFGWEGYQPFPTHPTLSQLRATGVRIPQDVVACVDTMRKRSPWSAWRWQPVELRSHDGGPTDPMERRAQFANPDVT